MSAGLEARIEALEEAVRAQTAILSRVEDALENQWAKAAWESFDPSEGTIPASVVNAIILDNIHPVKAYREWRGMTQALLADAVGSQAAYISQIETGVRSGGTSIMRKIAKALNIDVEFLV